MNAAADTANSSETDDHIVVRTPAANTMKETTDDGLTLCWDCRSWAIGSYHAEQLTALTPDYDVTLGGGIDTDPNVREAFEATFDATTYTAIDAFYEAIDAGIITTPNRFHETYAVTALEVDLHVLLEKPLAHTIDSAEHIVAQSSNTPSVASAVYGSRCMMSAAVRSVGSLSSPMTVIEKSRSVTMPVGPLSASITTRPTVRSSINWARSGKGVVVTTR
jgi:hypothetical protein